MNNVISTVLVAMITSGAVTAVLNAFLRSKEIGEQRRWEIKREACLEALQIVDSRFADYDWKMGEKSAAIDGQDFIPTANIRSCFNRLALTCKDSTVPQLFENCLNLSVDGREPEPLNMTTVVTLRNAIRKELGFGKDLETRVSWIMFINWKCQKKK